MLDLSKNKVIIAIDGGAASGKSSISKNIAKKLNILYIDTGAMYRAVALYFLQNNLEPTEENILKNIDNINIRLVNENGDNIVYLNGVNVTDKIREDSVSKFTPHISKFKILRDKMNEIQRGFANNESIIMDGRDIGTVVFVNATLKIYLTADIKVRAIRRLKDLKLDINDKNISEMIDSLNKRDYIDMNKEYGALKKADDAIVVDTSHNDIDKAVDEIISLLKERIK